MKQSKTDYCIEMKSLYEAVIEITLCSKDKDEAVKKSIEEKSLHCAEEESLFEAVRKSLHNTTTMILHSALRKNIYEWKFHSNLYVFFQRRVVSQCCIPVSKTHLCSGSAACIVTTG